MLLAHQSLFLLFKYTSLPAIAHSLAIGYVLGSVFYYSVSGSRLIEFLPWKNHILYWSWLWMNKGFLFSHLSFSISLIECVNFQRFSSLSNWESKLKHMGSLFQSVLNWWLHLNILYCLYIFRFIAIFAPVHGFYKSFIYFLNFRFSTGQKYGHSLYAYVGSTSQLVRVW